jgi:ribosome biogenesis GTPase A
VYFVDGKLGKGISALKREALAAGDAINARRIKRGIAPRAVRAAVIGFPNVGKSALINRLLGRKLAKSRNLPGVTRNLQWIRIGGIDNSQEGSIELLDSPGIIPAKQVDQSTAIKLAICNDIGEASYDRIVVAGVMCDHLNTLHKLKPAYVDMKTIKHRLKIPFDQMTGEEIVYELGETVYHGNHFSAADKLLGDFRKNMFNYGSLEKPLFQRSSATKAKVLIDLKGDKLVAQASTDLDHPSSDKLVVDGSGSSLKQGSPKITEPSKSTKQEELEKIIMSPLDVGKGNYDGW